VYGWQPFCRDPLLYRQSLIYVHGGVKPGRSTLANWVDQCSASFQPLKEIIRRYAMVTAKLHASGTPVPGLESADGKTCTAPP